MGQSQKGLSAEVGQSAAAGLLWLSKGKGDHCGNVAGGPLSSTETSRLVSHLLQFAGQAGIFRNQPMSWCLQYMLLLSHLPSDLFVRCG